MILGVHHAQISIPKGHEDQARAFYCTGLGLLEIQKPEILKARGGLWLQLSNLQVHIGTEEGVDPRQTKAHLAYEVKSIMQIRERLQSLGIEAIPGTKIPGYVRLECRDPFGNRVEFIEKTFE